MSGKPRKGGVVGKESFQRVNYLYQMAALVKNPTLSAGYTSVAKLVAQKSVLRMEPEMKRKICKRCKNILIPGTTAQLEVTGTNTEVCEIKCNNCESKKRFHVNPLYKMWLDNPDSIVEVITTSHPPVTSDSTSREENEVQPVHR